MAKVVLHYGCTTAVQADFAKKPIMTFIPNSIKNTNYKMDYFSNKIGNDISNFDDNKTNFDQLENLRDNKNEWIDNISYIDSIDFLSKEILDHVKNDSNYFKSKIPLGVKFDWIENSKNFLKNLLKKNPHELENFKNINECFKASSNFFNYKVNTTKINKYCYIVEGRKKNNHEYNKNVSVIIPTRNCIHLEKVLSSLDQLFTDIIVVGESNLDFNNFKNVKYFYNKNANAAKNRNFASEKAKNEYLFFLDSTVCHQKVS